MNNPFFNMFKHIKSNLDEVDSLIDRNYQLGLDLLVSDSEDGSSDCELQEGAAQIEADLLE